MSPPGQKIHAQNAEALWRIYLIAPGGSRFKSPFVPTAVNSTWKLCVYLAAKKIDTVKPPSWHR
eukprot:4636480-Karenia_brevis.AAC.1